MTGIAFGASNDTNPAGGFQVNGQYGTLVVQANGAYTYTLTVDGADVPDGATETFVYTMRDGDGDATTANLVITLDVVDNIPPTVAVNIVDTSLNDGDFDFGRQLHVQRAGGELHRRGRDGGWRYAWTDHRVGCRYSATFTATDGFSGPGSVTVECRQLYRRRRQSRLVRL